MARGTHEEQGLGVACPADDALPFPLPARFELVRALGRGGMGAVFEVRDHVRGEAVALKTLIGVNDGALARFKREFRAIADVAHPNLITLHELQGEGERWFFTMELIDGVDLLAWVQAPRAPAQGTPPAPANGEVEVTRDLAQERLARALPPPADVARLRRALVQMCDALGALHAGGIVHRDVKPSNVLMTPAGRCVLLDFGVAQASSNVAASGSTPGRELVGTPAYMAPEQARGTATPASDLYALAVVLFEALTGARPFSGGGESVLLLKESLTAPRVRELRPDAPADLDELCAALLRRDPAARPSLAEVRARLAGGAPDGAATPAVTAAALPGLTDEPLVGRDAELATLRAALAEAQRGRQAVVHVVGASGLGKSALVTAFVAEAVAAGALVLRGRCYERETAPYKALDGVVDALAQHLGDLGEAETEALAPRHAAALARLFPVLRDVPALRASERSGEAIEPHELRRRACEALRELLGRLADRRALVIAIDDLQWGDADSAPLLEAITRAPDAPPLLLVSTARARGADAGELERVLAEGALAGARRLELGPLPPAAARSLARRLLPSAAPEVLESIARESGGHPYFLRELTSAAPGTAGPPGLDDVLAGRVAGLDAEARRLLELTAVAARPCAPEVLVDAAALERGAGFAALGRLQAARLLRRTAGGDDTRVETHHDRLRETVVGRLDAATLRGHHTALARALRASATDEPLALVEHFRGAGEATLAAGYALGAAARAAAALAFDQAAALYRLALDLGAGETPQAAELQAALGDALVGAGRGAASAEAYLAAAAGEAGPRAQELRRRAAEQLLRSGHIDAGTKTMREVLATTGARLPTSTAGSVAAIVWARARLRLRGLRLAERRDVPQAELARVDALWSAAAGLSQVDPLRGAVASARGLVAALRSGDARRAARALALDASVVAAEGTRRAARVEELFEVAARLAEHAGDAQVHALVRGCRAFATYEQGRFRQAHDQCEATLTELRERSGGLAWELGSMQFYSLCSLMNLGEMTRARSLADRYLREARQRDDLFTSTIIRALVVPSIRMAEDLPDEARRESDQAVAAWSSAGFHHQHFMNAFMHIQLDIYVGDPASACRRADELGPKLRASLMSMAQVVRGAFVDVAGRAALADGRLGVARAASRRLRRESSPWCRAMGLLLRAGIQRADGPATRARAAYEEAAAAFGNCDMPTFCSVARFRAAELLEGEEAARRRGAALAVLAAAGMAAPERVVDLLAPQPPGQRALPAP